MVDMLIERIKNNKILIVITGIIAFIILVPIVVFSYIISMFYYK